MKYIALSLLLCCFLCELQAGGPWPKKKGEGYAQLAFFAIPSINRLSINAYRTKFLNRAIFDMTADLYAEYGVTNRLTLSAGLPIKFVSASQEVYTVDSTMLGDRNFGTPGTLLDAGFLADLSNFRLAAKYNFLAKKVYMSGHFMVSAPTAIQAYNPNTALRSAYPCWGFQPSLSLGYSSNKIYTYLETGMNFRTDNYSHQWVANFEIGWKLGKNPDPVKPAYLAVGLDAIICLPGGADVPNSNEEVQTGLYVNNQNFVAFTFKAIVPITTQIGMNLSLSGGLWANNVQQGPNIGIGVYYKWKPKEKPAKSLG